MRIVGVNVEIKTVETELEVDVGQDLRVLAEEEVSEKEKCE